MVLHRTRHGVFVFHMITVLHRHVTRPTHTWTVALGCCTDLQRRRIIAAGSYRRAGESWWKGKACCVECLLLAVSAMQALRPCSWRGVGGSAWCRDEAAGVPVV